MGLIGAIAGRKAAKRQKRLTGRYKKELTRLSGLYGDIASSYQQQYQDLSQNFDPYELEREFNSLYEAVIMPMERQFSETTLPQLRQSYSGGGYGSAMFSGGRETAEANARQQLSMNEALLKYQARETGIQRNFQEYDRRRQDLGIQFELEKSPVELGFSVAEIGRAHV